MTTKKVNGWMILNDIGNPWSLALDHTEVGAQKHLQDFREQYKMQMTKHTVVPCTISLK